MKTTYIFLISSLLFSLTLSLNLKQPTSKDDDFCNEQVVELNIPRVRLINNFQNMTIPIKLDPFFPNKLAASALGDECEEEEEEVEEDEEEEPVKKPKKALKAEATNEEVCGAPNDGYKSLKPKALFRGRLGQAKNKTAASNATGEGEAETPSNQTFINATVTITSPSNETEISAGNQTAASNETAPSNQTTPGNETVGEEEETDITAPINETAPSNETVYGEEEQPSEEKLTKGKPSRNLTNSKIGPANKTGRNKTKAPTEEEEAEKPINKSEVPIEEEEAEKPINKSEVPIEEEEAEKPTNKTNAPTEEEEAEKPKNKTKAPAEEEEAEKPKNKTKAPTEAPTNATETAIPEPDFITQGGSAIANRLPTNYLPSEAWFTGWNIIPKSFWVDTEFNAGKDYIVIKSKDLYLSCLPNGEAKATKSNDASNLFLLESIGQNLASLRSFYGGYLSVNKNGEVNCSSRSHSTNSQFSVLLTNKNCEKDDANYMLLESFSGRFLTIRDESVSGEENESPDSLFKGINFDESTSKCAEAQAGQEGAVSASPDVSSGRKKNGKAKKADLGKGKSGKNCKNGKKAKLGKSKLGKDKTNEKKAKNNESGSEEITNLLEQPNKATKPKKSKLQSVVERPKKLKQTPPKVEDKFCPYGKNKRLLILNIV